MGDRMRPFQVMKRALEKAEEAAEKTGEVISKGLAEGLDKVKGLGGGLKKEFLRLYKKTEGNKTSEKKVGFRRISEEAVKTKTGKVWGEWFTILDTWSVKENGHTQSTKHLREHYGLSPWWAQAVTIRYEWEMGLRK
jgi:DNA mismatch repair ATPase MutS